MPVSEGPTARTGRGGGGHFLPKNFLWACSMGPYLLQRGLKYGPLFCKWLIIVIQWIYKDSELGARTRNQRIYFGFPFRF